MVFSTKKFYHPSITNALKVDGDDTTYRCVYTYVRESDDGVTNSQHTITIPEEVEGAIKTGARLTIDGTKRFKVQRIVAAEKWGRKGGMGELTIFLTEEA